jgi:ferrochelatase
VIPFLENVLRGRNVPRERMLEVAEHYYRFGGRSPINDQCRALIAALKEQVALPVYWGNRNWRPMLAETVRQMAADGVKRAVAVATSAYSSYSGCRQYIENIAAARAAAGEGAPVIDKLPPFWSHEGFVTANADRVAAALEKVPEERRAESRLVFTAHSIPAAMASQCRYEEQLVEISRRVSERAGHHEWDLVWQSRSGPPTEQWLEPDILNHLCTLGADGVKDVVVSPVGFLSDHMEVIYDLDEEASRVAAELGVNFVRAETAGTHPAVISMIKELVETPFEVCVAGCCPPPARPAAAR